MPATILNQEASGRVVAATGGGGAGDVSVDGQYLITTLDYWSFTRDLGPLNRAGLRPAGVTGSAPGPYTIPLSAYPAGAQYALLTLVGGGARGGSGSEYNDEGNMVPTTGGGGQGGVVLRNLPVPVADFGTSISVTVGRGSPTVAASAVLGSGNAFGGRFGIDTGNVFSGGNAAGDPNPGTPVFTNPTTTGFRIPPVGYPYPMVFGETLADLALWASPIRPFSGHKVSGSETFGGHTRVFRASDNYHFGKGGDGGVGVSPTTSAPTLGDLGNDGVVFIEWVSLTPRT